MTRKTKSLQVNQDYDIVVTGRHVLVTEPMKDYAREKVSKIEKFGLRIIDVVVTMDMQRTNHIVDIILKVNDFKVKSTAVSDDMYTSIDKAVDKVQAQLRRYKTRLLDRQTRPVQMVDMNVNVLRASDSDIDDVNEEIESENERRIAASLKPHEVVKQETRPLKTLTQEEAIMKMELCGDLFLIYRSEETGNIKVIYRRADGNFGVIEPER